MRFRIAAAVLAAIALASIAYSEYRKAEVTASGAPIAYLIADSQQELTRLPMTLTRISDEEEIQIGDAIAKRYSDAFNESKKPEGDLRFVQDYIDRVGRSMVPHTRRKLPYKFHYVSDPSFVNAFALPGGHVFIGQGLINLMDSEDQLASVLGHEVEHIDLGHCVERVQIEARLRHLGLSDFGSLVDIPYQVFAAGYTKEQELAADANGTQLEVSAGYSPMGAVRLFQTFAKFESGQYKPANPQEELASVALTSLSEYFRSHPRSQERAQEIERLMAANHWPAPAERELQIAFIALNAQASAAMAEHKYERAAALAQRSLKQRPRQFGPREIVQQVAMYTGDFATAVKVAEELFAEQPAQIERERTLAEALAAERAGNAVQRLTAASARAPHDARSQRSIEIDLAGLRLLAGDDKPIGELLAKAKSNQNNTDAADYLPPNVAGEQIARIAHWYYLAGRYTDAVAQMDIAIELMPATENQRIDYAWACLQDNKLATAESFFERSYTGEGFAGKAVLQWRQEQKDAALSSYNMIASDPRWANRAWVSATYGPTVYNSLRELSAEVERRRLAKTR